MHIEVKIEKIPNDAAEAKVTKIHKQVGEEVNAGDVLLEIEAQKTSLPVKSTSCGIIKNLYVEAGQIVKMGDLLLGIEGEMVPEAAVNNNFDYFAGLTTPQKESIECELCIIGAGPGGYVAAIKAAQMGSKVVLIEKEQVGGTCLNWGCIPTKCLVRSAEVYSNLQAAEDYGCSAENINFNMGRVVQRKDAVVQQLRQGIESLLENNGVITIKGQAELTDANTTLVKQGMNETTVKSKHIIIATGSRICTPNIPGAQLKQVINSDIALQLQEVPDQLVIIGGGVIGMEFAFIFANFGVNVSVVEYMDEILSNCDKDICTEISRLAAEKGIKIYKGARVETILPAEDDNCIVVFTQDQQVKYIATQQVLMAIGREPVTEGLGLEKLGIKLNANKKGIQVNEQMQTSIPGIYAIGDVTNQVLLAHVASHQGLAAVKNIMGEICHMRYDAIPSAIFTDPEIGLVGLTEEMASAQGLEFNVGKFPLAANGKALSMGDSRGFIKLVSEKGSGRVLGAAIIGPHATDLIADLTLAVNRNLTTRDIIETIYAHPTTAEIIHEAALAAEGRALHFAGQ